MSTQLPVTEKPTRTAPSGVAAQSTEETLSDAEKLRREEKAAGFVMLARNMLRKGQRDAAKTQLQQAFALNPTDCAAFELLGDMYLEQGEQEKAIAVFERGRKHHPRHAAFEEKIALAHVDLAEMENDRLMRQHFLEHGDTERWQDRKPGLASVLSVMVPGAGHFYLEMYERGAVFLGIAVLTFLGWALPLRASLSSQALKAAASGGGMLSGMSSSMRSWFWLMMAAWLFVVIVSAIDAWRSTLSQIEDRKRALGI